MTVEMSSISLLADIGQTNALQGRGPEAAEKFEALIIKMMVKEMRSSLPKDGLLQSNGMEMVWDMFDQEVSQRIAHEGGFGLQDSIGESLAQKMAPPIAMMPVEGHITSGYGKRADPFTGVDAHHTGLDIAAPKGTAIRAVKSGVITYSGDKGRSGNTVIIDHGDGTRSSYSHCDKLAAKVGEHVNAGEAVATVGSTGRSTAPHLHFEVWRGSERMDPAVWLAAHQIEHNNSSNNMRNDPSEGITIGDAVGVRGTP